ncbi:urease accessory protein UreD [Cellulosimicrobium sp. CUA-896]|uniref:urease accessory protein UreD n=1 Tax=Cellulosimicrobium sp. CUA-896 TaxID=1517881 RepID=UPI001C9E60F2|nr:urease accessory protein UreD [Cellulosimicrobium sp. CUA-896]
MRASAGRVRCDLHLGPLSPRVLSTGPGVARVALVATRALLLGGDHVRVEVCVGEGVELELVEVSGTVAYPGRGRAASWHVDVRVADGGLLVWDALPFVVAQEADVDRRTDVELGRDAAALLRETIVLGRTGETGGRVRTRTRAERAHDGELFVEDLDLGRDRSLPGILGTARVVDSVLLVGARPPDPGDGSPAGAAAGSDPLRLDLDGPGAVARHLGAGTHDSGLAAVAAGWAGAVRAAREPTTSSSKTAAVPA